MKETPQFKKLFEPVQLGQMRLQNRMVMAPIVPGFATKDGYVTQRLIDFYEERAKGGVGLIIVGATSVQSPVGKARYFQMVASDDSFIAGLEDLARVIKKHGVFAALQLHHAGANTLSSYTGVQPIGPSGIWGPSGEVPHELTIPEIEDVVSSFVKAAERAARAGFDGVELHGAHAYLIAQFLSATWNKRQDVYGGSLQNRARFLIEIIQATKNVNGQDFPVWCRLNAFEVGMEGGNTIEETKQIAQMAERAGADAISLSAWAQGLPPRAPSPMAYPPGALLRYAEEVKRVVGIPVIAAGRIDPYIAEKALSAQKVDLIAVAKAVIADPEYPRKVAAGKLDDIRPCIGCNVCVDLMHNPPEGSKCSVNASVGKEQENIIRRANIQKKVLVVGGGPAGMEAARIASQRGHQVTLCERALSLGGQLLLAAVPPSKDRINAFVTYLSHQLDKLGVKIELGQEVTQELVLAKHPDVVVMTSGARPTIQKIPSIDKAKIALAWDVLAGKTEVGSKIVIMGGGLVGCELAEYLADKGKSVTILEESESMAAKVISSVRDTLISRLGAKRVVMLTGVKYERVSAKYLILSSNNGGGQKIEFDTLISAGVPKPNKELFNALQGKVPAVHRAGDCIEPRSILEAIDEAFSIANKI